MRGFLSKKEFETWLQYFERRINAIGSTIITYVNHAFKHETGGIDPINSLAGEVLTSGTIDGDRLPAISQTKRGGVPATGIPATYYLRDDGAFRHITQNEVEFLTTSDSPVFVTVKLSALTDTYFPYHVSDAVGLANSNMTRVGNKIGINVAVPADILEVRDPDTTSPPDAVEVLSVWHNNIERFRVRRNGQGSFIINNGAAECGRISYATSPLGDPGITMYTVGDTNQFNIVNTGSYFELYYDADGAGSGLTIEQTSEYIGLNKSNPTERLDVVGNLRLSGAFMPNNAPGSSGNLLLSGGAGAADTWLANGTTAQYLKGGAAPTWASMQDAVNTALAAGIVCYEEDVVCYEGEVVYYA